MIEAMRALLVGLKNLFILLAALTLIGYIGNLLIDNPYIHGLLRKEINRSLEKYTYLSLKFEAINAKFLPLGIDIYGIEVRQKTNDESQPLFQAMHLQARISIWALLLSKREIFEVEVNGPKFRWPIPPIEQLLRMEKFPELQEDQGLPDWPLTAGLPFHQLAFTNAAIQLSIADKTPELPDLLRARLDGFDLSVTFHDAQNFEIISEIRRLNLEVEGKSLLQETQVKAHLLQRRDHLITKSLEINSSELQLNSYLDIIYEVATPSAPKLFVKNQPKQLNGMRINLKNTVSKADIGILGRYLRADDSSGPLEGEVDLSLHIPLDERDVSWFIKGKGKSQQAKLAGFKLLDSELDFKIDGEGMSFLNARVFKSQQLLARGKGYLAFTSAVPFNFEIVPEKLNLPTLLDILQVEDFSAVDTRLESELITLKGQAEPFSIQVDGLVDFREITLPKVLAELPSRYLDSPSCLLQTALTINEKAVTIENAKGNCRLQNEPVQSPLSLHGQFAYTEAEGLDFHLNSPALHGPMLNHFSKIPATGTLAAQLGIKGPYNNIVLHADLKAKDLDFGGFQSRNAAVSLHFPIEDDTVYVKHFEMEESSAGTLRLDQASFGIGAPFKFSGDIEAQGLSSSFFKKGLAQTFDIHNLDFGIKALQGQLAGDLFKPFAYSGKLHFVAQNFQYDGQTFFQEASGTLVGDVDTWNLQGAYAKLEQLELRADIAIQHRKTQSLPQLLLHELGIGPDDLLRVQLKTINKNLTQYRTNESSSNTNHLAALPYIGEYFRKHNFGGLIHFESDLEGKVDQLQGKLEGAIEQPFVWGIPISSFYISGFIEGSKLHIPEFRHAGNALVGRLNIDFGKKDLPYDWYFYLNQMDIRAFLTSTFADDPRNFAYLSAEWTMKGKLGNFWNSSGELVLSRIRSKFFRNLGSRTSSIELNSDQAIQVQISPEQWRLLDKRPLKLQGEFFDLELSAGNNRLPEQLDISLRGSIKLDILKNFTHLAETARGEILVEGYLKGSLDQPDLSIRFRERKLDPFNMREWTPVSLGVVDYGPPLTSMSLDVEVKSDRVIVHRLLANKGREGTIDVKGILSYNQAAEEQSRLLIKLNRIEMNRLTIPVLKSADLVASGDLALSGNKFPFLLTGNLKIDRFYSIGNFDLRREIVASLYDSKLRASASDQSGGPIVPYVNLDVGILADKSIVLKNKSIEAVMSANLRVRGTDAQPLLLGQIIADRGTFSYRRLFKINQAVISFDEPVSPPNPRLDIIGETTVNPYQVQVMVNGDLTSPKVTLTSDPPNREDGSPITNLDIVLLISTGKIPEQANKTAERASVNEIFSSFLVFAEEPIEKLFDLSGQTVIREVYIDSYLSEAEQRPITRLNVPFNLWGTANAVVQVDDESNTKLSFEYPIHEGITFSGSLDSKKSKQETQENNIPKDTGFDLKFRFGFD